LIDNTWIDGGGESLYSAADVAFPFLDGPNLLVSQTG